MHYQRGVLYVLLNVDLVAHAGPRWTTTEVLTTLLMREPGLWLVMI